MSTGPQVLERLAPICRMHLATGERYFAELRAAGIIPKSGKGGGKSAVHFESLHIAYAILSFGAPQPGGAVDAAKRLGELWPVEDKTPSLLYFLTNKITDRAKHVLHGDTKYLSDPAQGWELTLCLDPLEAWMSWTAKDGSEQRLRYAVKQPDQYPLLRGFLPPEINRGLRRLTIITLDVLNAAAELWADTIARQQNLPIPTAPAAETENAALAGAAPIQDRNPIPATSKREHRGERGISQALSSRGPGHFRQPTRSQADVEPSPPHCLVA